MLPSSRSQQSKDSEFRNFRNGYVSSESVLESLNGVTHPRSAGSARSLFCLSLDGSSVQDNC
jgi:hypothetical protein